MYYKKATLSLLLLFIITTTTMGGTIRISQIDAKLTQVTQKVHLYLSITDQSGVPLEKLTNTDISLSERGVGEKKSIGNPESFEYGINQRNGVTYLFVIENSAFMYKSTSSKPEKQEESQMINRIKSSISRFQDHTSPRDQFTLMLFNKVYQGFSSPSSNRQRILADMKRIDDTIGDPEYIELHGSLERAVKELGEANGRKAIILITTGEEKIYYLLTQKVHPLFGTTVKGEKNSLKAIQQEGASLDVVFVGKKDKETMTSLQMMSQETGGAAHYAETGEELLKTYSKIANRINKEYLVSYQPTMEPVGKKRVFVLYSGNGQKKESSRLYFSPNLFGEPIQKLSSLFPAGILIPLVLLFAFALFSIKNSSKNQIEL